MKPSAILTTATQAIRESTFARRTKVLSHFKVSDTGCHEFQKYCSPCGYGMTCVQGQVVRAHRLSWFHHKGYITQGLVIMHICDNPKCINIAHLREDTYVANTQDCMKKGRGKYSKNEEYFPKSSRNTAYPKGENNKFAILSWALVEKIRSEMHKSQRDLAKELGVGKSTIGSIRAYRTWRTNEPGTAYKIRRVDTASRRASAEKQVCVPEGNGVS